MSALHEERQLNTHQRRALKLLAAAGEQGCTGTRLFNHGFTVGMVADLVWSGLATGHREAVTVGYRKIKVARIRITDAGRRALKRLIERRPACCPLTRNTAARVAS
jgi:hypothetical protein